MALSTIQPPAACRLPIVDYRLFRDEAGTCHVSIRGPGQTGAFDLPKSDEAERIGEPYGWGDDSGRFVTAHSILSHALGFECIFNLAYDFAARFIYPMDHDGAEVDGRLIEAFVRSWMSDHGPCRVGDLRKKP